MNVFGMFARHPRVGHVKTRLAKDLGAEFAAGLYAAFLDDLLERFRGVGDRRIVAFTPADDAARQYFERAAGDYELWPQPDGGLGDRIAAFFEQGFAAGARRIVLIGSDSPTLPADFVLQAFEALETHDCALGPATDGGFYLIGLRAAHRSLFDAIPWGGPDVLQRTVERIRNSRLTVSLCPVWYDVDTSSDVQFLRGHLAALQATGTADAAPSTAAFLTRKVSQGGATSIM